MKALCKVVAALGAAATVALLVVAIWATSNNGRFVLTALLCALVTVVAWFRAYVVEVDTPTVTVRQERNSVHSSGGFQDPYIRPKY